MAATNPISAIQRVPPPALVLGAMVSIQFGAAVAAGLIRELGPVVTVAIRLDAAALILAIIARPSLRGRTIGDWRAVAILAGSLAVMNIAFYNAIARIPLGIVTTIEFIGPLGLAAVSSRRPRDLIAIAVALAGVVAVSGVLDASLQGLDAAGLVFTVIASAGWVTYILATRSIGKRFRQVDGLAFAMIGAAALVTPLGVAVGVSSGLNLQAWQVATGASVGLLSSAIPYSLELVALRRIDTRVFGILLSLEPAVAALVGLIVLAQALTPMEVGGMALVVAASVIVMADRRAAPEEEAAEIG
jgi:inner membrane transporter RhtA